MRRRRRQLFDPADIAQGGALLATSYADLGLRTARLAGVGRFVGVVHVFEVRSRNCVSHTDWHPYPGE